MPTFTPGDTSVGYSFFFEADGITSQIAEVSAISVEAKPITIKHQSALGQPVAQTVPGKPEPGTFTIKRGLTDKKDWSDWAKLAQEGKIDQARKSGSLVILTYAGEEVSRVNFEGMWITKLEVGAVKAFDTAPLMETATMSFNRMERVK